MASEIPPKKIGSPEEPAPAKAPLTPADLEQEATMKAGFAAQLDQKDAIKPKTSFHAAFGKMLGSEATAEQIDRFVNTWVQDQLRDMRRQEQKLHKTWRNMR